MGEWVAAIAAIMGLLGSMFNLYVTMTIKLQIAEQKNWTMEKFVEKADMRSAIQTYLSQERTAKT